MFLRVAADGTRAQLLEKASFYREPLVAILERLLSDASPRTVRPKAAQPTTSPTHAGTRRLSIDGLVELAIPEGWEAAPKPPGHWTIHRANRGCLIMVSCRLLPDDPSESLSAADWLAILLERSGNRDLATPGTSFDHPDLDLAWAECPTTMPDPIRPSGPRRPVRCRHLVAVNGWTQAILISYWPEVHTESSERAWREVVTSLRLANRTGLEPQG